jgi:hypothetical protein
MVLSRINCHISFRSCGAKIRRNSRNVCVHVSGDLKKLCKANGFEVHQYVLAYLRKTKCDMLLLTSSNYIQTYSHFSPLILPIIDDNTR